MSQTAYSTRPNRMKQTRDADPVESIRRLVGAIGAEIEALKQERADDPVRSARMRLSAAYVKARLERHGVEPASN